MDVQNIMATLGYFSWGAAYQTIFLECAIKNVAQYKFSSNVGLR